MLFCIKENNKTRKTKASPPESHSLPWCTGYPSKRVRECKSRKADESPEICKGEECMASGAPWFFGCWLGREAQEVPPVHEGACLCHTVLSCEQNSCSSSLALESVCISACGRSIKPSATPQNVPHALLHYVGWGWAFSLLLAGRVWACPMAVHSCFTPWKATYCSYSHPQAGNSPWDSNESQHS